VRVGVKGVKGSDGKYLEDYSYAVLDDIQDRSTNFNVVKRGNNLYLRTNALEVEVNLDSALIDIRDLKMDIVIQKILSLWHLMNLL